MGKRLSASRNSENMHNIMKFTDGEYRIKAHVSVYDNNTELWHFNNVDIIVSKMFNCYNINMPWEDLEKQNYRDLGLYGYYSTEYSIINYVKKGTYLKIQSSDSNKVIVLDKI